MEDALAPDHILFITLDEVLILVVMEDALALDNCRAKRGRRSSVLILVVMEDALARISSKNIFKIS